tara:strand:+ start:640 stop:1206 length:567 start_codon:yes stop_codon:yes gene_type:complete
MIAAKKILLSSVSLFLAFQTYKLFYLLISQSINLNWAYAFFVACLINLFITGFWAFLGFVFPTHKLLPLHYYNQIHVKRVNRLYKILNGEQFRLFLLATFWKSKKQRAKYFNGKKNGIEEMIFQSKQAEFGHLAALILILISCILLVINNYWKAVMICLCINIIFNFYPVLLQRKLRSRIFQIKDRLL